VQKKKREREVNAFGEQFVRKKLTPIVTGPSASVRISSEV